MVIGKAIVRNEQGIHCRPSSVIIKATMQMEGDLTATTEHGRCDLKSMMGLLSLGLCPGAEVEIRVSGEQEKENCRMLVELFEREYDFPPVEESEKSKTSWPCHPEKEEDDGQDS